MTPSIEPLKEGDIAPDFVLPDESGKLVRLSDFRGRRVVLYFYPKDDTPGCTLEARSFRDELDEFDLRGATVLGVSIDSIQSHQSFKTQYQLNFPLLSDSERDTVRRYGVWREKSLMGVHFRWTERATFVIDEQGIIRKIFHKVKVRGHTSEVLSSLGPATPR